MITLAEYKQLEYQAIQNGISVEQLMENAGREVYLAVKKWYVLNEKKVVIFCGQGNNGGDGLVAARYFAQDCSVLILFFGDKEKLSEEAKENYRKVFGKVNIIRIDSPEDLEKFHFQKNLKFIFIDALLGTGIKGKIREPISSAINLYNSVNGIKVTVDLPTGIDPDTGIIEDKCCNSDLIICFHDLKQGLQKFKKKTVVVDIGMSN